MKPGPYIIFVLALCALMLASCQSAPIPVSPADESTLPPDVKKSLDKMGFEKAPTLGPIIRQGMVCWANKDFAGFYDRMNKPWRDQMQVEMSSEYSVRKERIEEIENILKDPKLGDAEKAAYTAQLESARKDVAQLESFNGDARKYFDWKMKATSRGGDDSMGPLFRVDTARVVSEKITGGKGVLTLTDDVRQIDIILHFVDESGAWKIDKLYIVDTQPAAEEKGVPKDIQKALDRIGYDKAPTLGAIDRQLDTYMIEGKFDKIYDMMCKASREKTGELIGGQGKEKFVSYFEADSAGKNLAEMFFSANHFVVVGEKIEGDKGRIFTYDKATHGEDTIYYVKEDGVWKWDSQRASATPDDDEP